MTTSCARAFAAAVVAVVAVAVSLTSPWTPVARLAAQDAPAAAALHARSHRRLTLRNVMVIYGSARPPYGPADVVIENGAISYIGTNGVRVSPGSSEAVIDGRGKYVMPGIVNTHMHWHEDRQPGFPQPIQYERHLYLAAGVTTVREVGGDFDLSKRWQADSDAHRIVAPRIFVYPVVSKGQTGRPDEIRAWIQDIARRGADGLKIIAVDRDQLAAIMREAHALNLRTAAHIGTEETTARDYVDLGVTSIEHFYGIADAALDGVQRFPPGMNFTNEIQRFARAGELYAQADPARLSQVVGAMAAKGVAWTPTLSIYEAARDLQRARSVPWFQDYLHPSLEAFFKPSLENHGSFFFGWTSTQESRWKQQYRIWMDAVREFGRKGGLITTGDDAGYLYSVYGFGISRELELQQEAGFEPLEVIEHATWNGARLLGQEHRLGKLREGYAADVLVVNGNPLENLKLLNPYGTDVMRLNRAVVPNEAPIEPSDRVDAAHGGGIEWTIKDGIPYHVPTLMREVRDMVAAARRRARSAPTP
ncbi:MAG: amidohydrolase family protein [Vicinamibacterales bacterium]